LSSSRPAIIVIEDDPRFRETLTLSLQDLGYSVFSCETPSEALAQKRSGEAWIALDLQLAEGSSLSQVSALRESFPNAIIVMMTGYGSIASAVEAVKRGANHYLQKPFSIQTLISCFKGELAQSLLSAEHQSLARREREYIEFVLQSSDGNISTAAKRLGIHRQSLQRKLKKFSPSR